MPSTSPTPCSSSARPAACWSTPATCTSSSASAEPPPQRSVERAARHRPTARGAIAALRQPPIMHRMQRLNRYVGKQIALAILFITVALTVAVWLTQTLRFIDTIVNSGLPLGLTFQFLVLLIPGLVSIILP